MTVEGVKLGRMIFYDPIVSSNGRTCSICHNQDKSFMIDPVENGLDPKVYPNIPPLINIAWNPDFGWAGEFPTLDEVPEADFTPPFFNPNMDTLVARFRKHPVYPGLFRKVYHGEDVLTKDKIVPAIAKVLTQFARTIVSYNSKFDQYQRGETQLTPSEYRGMTIFFSEKGDCFHCHGTVLFTDNQFHNTGLTASPQGVDQGRYMVTGKMTDMGKFSSPTLRNVARTGPYMHDGSYKTLMDVINFYDHGVQHSETLDPIMTLPGKETGLHLTQKDKLDLEAFLKTLTDTTVLTNKDYSKP
jgi:cytochrome c peroxidase